MAKKSLLEKALDEVGKKAKAKKAKPKKKKVFKSLDEMKKAANKMARND